MSDAGVLSVGSFAWGLSGGVASFFSPCALPMLPAYLSYYIAGNTEEVDDSTTAAVRRGTWFGGAAGLGMLGVFVAIALLTGVAGDLLRGMIAELIPIVGVLVILIGVAMLTDNVSQLSTSVTLPEWRDPSTRHFIAFGVLFALAALGCTAPVFIGVTLTALATGGLWSGVSFVGGYATGMIGLFVVMTGAIALAKDETARQLRSLIPYVERASALLLVLAGGYMLYYYWQLTKLA